MKISHITISSSSKDELISKTIHDHLKPTAETGPNSTWESSFNGNKGIMKVTRGLRHSGFKLYNHHHKNVTKQYRPPSVQDPNSAYAIVLGVHHTTPQTGTGDKLGCPDCLQAAASCAFVDLVLYLTVLCRCQRAWQKIWSGIKSLCANTQMPPKHMQSDLWLTSEKTIWFNRSHKYLNT